MDAVVIKEFVSTLFKKTNTGVCVNLGMLDIRVKLKLSGHVLMHAAITDAVLQRSAHVIKVSLVLTAA